jgi:peptide deformylase
MQLLLTNNHLYTLCRPIDFDKSLDNLRFAQILVQTMIREHGIGLSANQVGYDMRLFVMYINEEMFHCFEPEIISHGHKIKVEQERCLSFPGKQCLVPRYESIDVRFANANGSFQERNFTGLAARCFQHELDHLNGITMYARQKNS